MLLAAIGMSATGKDQAKYKRGSPPRDIADRTRHQRFARKSTQRYAICKPAL